MSSDDIKIPPSSMGQAMVFLADVVCSYISGMQPSGFTGADAELKTYHQVAISLFLHQLLIRSKHKVEMAGILDVLAGELRAAAEQPGAETA